MKFKIFGYELTINHTRNVSPDKISETITNIKPDPRIQSFIEQQQKEDREYEIRMEAIRKEHNEYKRLSKINIFPHIKVASRNDYIEWLHGFLNAGNKPSHFYDYPFDQWENFYIALESFRITPLYGSASINIIVPKGIQITGDPGHTNLYICDGYRTSMEFVPVFSDTIS